LDFLEEILKLPNKITTVRIKLENESYTLFIKNPNITFVIIPKVTNMIISTSIGAVYLYRCDPPIAIITELTVYVDKYTPRKATTCLISEIPFLLFVNKDISRFLIIFFYKKMKFCIENSNIRNVHSSPGS
jgi:hypothetical protein